MMHGGIRYGPLPSPYAGSCLEDQRVYIGHIESFPIWPANIQGRTCGLSRDLKAWFRGLRACWNVWGMYM